MIILSIPFLTKIIFQKKQKNIQIIGKNTDLDYSEDFKKFPSELIDDKTIITIRSKEEGGIHDFDLPDKIGFFDKIISQKNCLCDMEINENSSSNIFRNSCRKFNLVIS